MAIGEAGRTTEDGAMKVCPLRDSFFEQNGSISGSENTAFISKEGEDLCESMSGWMARTTTPVVRTTFKAV
jgi:hypothetical protein